MKIKSIRNIFALALILATIMGCSRFEDGPCISFKTIENRVHGKYKVIYFEKNGVDLSTQWCNKYQLTYDFHDIDWTREKERWLDIEGTIVLDTASIIYNHSEGYSLYNDNQNYYLEFQLKIDTMLYPNCLDAYPILDTVYTLKQFQITKLTNTQIWLVYSNSSNQYYVKLKEI